MKWVSMHDSDGIYNVYRDKGKRGGKGGGTCQDMDIDVDVDTDTAMDVDTDTDIAMDMDMKVYTIEGYVQALIESL